MTSGAERISVSRRSVLKAGAGIAVASLAGCGAESSSAQAAGERQHQVSWQTEAYLGLAGLSGLTWAEIPGAEDNRNRAKHGSAPSPGQAHIGWRAFLISAPDNEVRRPDLFTQFDGAGISVVLRKPDSSFVGADITGYMGTYQLDGMQHEGFIVHLGSADGAATMVHRTPAEDGGYTFDAIPDVTANIQDSADKANWPAPYTRTVVPGWST